MFHHEFIVNNYNVWVRRNVSKLEAFASICPVLAYQFLVSAYRGATPLECKELDKLPRPPFATAKVVRRPMGPLHDTHAILVPHSSHARALHLRHEHVVSAAVLQTPDRLQLGVGWSMVALSTRKTYIFLQWTTPSPTTSFCHNCFKFQQFKLHDDAPTPRFALFHTCAIYFSKKRV